MKLFRFQKIETFFIKIPIAHLPTLNSPHKSLKSAQLKMLSRTPSKPWSVDQFEEFRPHMTQMVRTAIVPNLHQHQPDTENKNRILLHGQVKVGKREIVEYMAVRDSFHQNRIHVFISAFHRKADESQRDELGMHNIHVFSIHDKKRRDAAIRFIGEQLEQNMQIVIHWDECDYGTGDRQNLANVYRMFRDHPGVFNILYSATPEEMLYSAEIAEKDEADAFITDFYEEGSVVKYIPPVGYCGAQAFLDHGLVFQALPFFEICENSIRLSEQARSILSDAKASIRVVNRKRRNLQSQIEDAEDDGDQVLAERLRAELKQLSVRNIISLRLSYFLNDDDDDENDTDENDTDEKETDDVSSVTSNGSSKGKAIYTFLKNSQFIAELNPDNVLIIADKPDQKELVSLPNVKTEMVQWGKRAYWDGITTEKIVIIVNDQTSTRSTEWVCHDRMFTTHDYRKRLTFNTVAQAQLRVAHYEQNYGGFQSIRVYGDVKTFQFAVGQISAAEYLNTEWITRKIPKSNPPRYRIKSFTTKKLMPAIRVEHNGKVATYEGVPDPNGYSLELSQKILIQLGGTNNGHSKMSQRVRGNSKRVPKIKAKFYPCEPTQTGSVLETLYRDPDVADRLNGHTFNAGGYFKYPILNERGETDYMGFLRVRKVLNYADIAHNLWGIRMGHEQARLTECYKDGVLGLCLRVATGEFEETSDLEAYKSMYQTDV